MTTHTPLSPDDDNRHCVVCDRWIPLTEDEADELADEPELVCGPKCSELSAREGRLG